MEDAQPRIKQSKAKEATPKSLPPFNSKSKISPFIGSDITSPSPQVGAKNPIQIKKYGAVGISHLVHSFALKSE